MAGNQITKSVFRAITQSAQIKEKVGIEIGITCHRIEFIQNEHEPVALILYQRGDEIPKARIVMNLILHFQFDSLSDDLL